MRYNRQEDERVNEKRKNVTLTWPGRERSTMSEEKGKRLGDCSASTAAGSPGAKKNTGGCSNCKELGGGLLMPC
jgi:hypothetical protein